MPAIQPDEGRRYLVRGRVQGVGFRWWTRREAARLGLAGSVRNLPGGSVEILVGGAVEDLDAFGESLAGGPSGASVTGLECFSLGHVPTGDFRILH